MAKTQINKKFESFYSTEVFANIYKNVYELETEII